MRIPHLVSTGLYTQGGTQFRGICFFLPGVELSSRAIASSSQVGTQFRGDCFLLSGRNSVPGVSASSSEGGTEFRLPTSDDCTIKRSCYKLQLLTNKNIVKRKIGCYNIAQGNQSKAACPLRQGLHPPRRKKGGLPMITYSDLIQFCIFVVVASSLDPSDL